MCLITVTCWGVQKWTKVSIKEGAFLKLHGIPNPNVLISSKDVFSVLDTVGIDKLAPKTGIEQSVN